MYMGLLQPWKPHRLHFRLYIPTYLLSLYYVVVNHFTLKSPPSSGIF